MNAEVSRRQVLAAGAALAGAAALTLLRPGVGGVHQAS
ncbi:twin-arginine translocation signal domain-containing protein [Lentzea sp.]|nr:twin-arginine translocation signal domain-containing protein [Lentzea sp.]HUQ60620.1 twin-arginine translocation signal domain-containing protein [Lentzea sp.]